MTRTLALIALVIGAALAAAGGIRLGAGEYQASLNEGRTVLDPGPGAEPELVIAPAAPASPALRVAEWQAAAGWTFAGGLLLLVAGAVLARIGEHRKARDHGTGNHRNFAADLARLAAAVEAARDALGVVPHAQSLSDIERISLEEITPLIEDRFALQHQHGLAGAALVLGPLSGAERLVNRAWSALVDEHLPESRASLDQAASQAVAAREAMQALINGA